MLMTKNHSNGYFVFSIICVLIYTFLFSTTIAFADELIPPATNTKETINLPADESQSASVVKIEEKQSNGQAEALDAITAAPTDPQDELTNTAEELDAVEDLPAVEEGKLPEQELVKETTVEEAEPTLDTNSEMAEETGQTTLEQLPAEITVVVLIDDQIEPLVTQEAAEALELGDPMWCPAGGKPGDAVCSSSYTSLANLLADLRSQNGGTGVDQDGTIWIEDLYNSSVNDNGVTSFNLNGNTLTTWAKHALTFQGGWNGNTGSTGINGVSDFSVPIRILNWNNTVSINDISISSTSSNGLTVTTTGDINLHNVTSNTNSNHGASLNNTSGSKGNIKVTGISSFNGNNLNGLVANSNGTITLQNVTTGNNGSNGLVANANGTISLHDVTANTNGSNGASLNDSNGMGTIMLTGTNVFDGNASVGLRAVSSDIVSNANITANNNGTYGALFNNSGGTGKVVLSGNYVFNNNTLDGLRVVSTGNITSTSSTSLTANTNGQYGVLLNNNSGTGISLAGVFTLTNNALDGLRALSNVDITLAANLTSTGNGRYGAFLSNSAGAGNITLTGTSIFNGNTSDGLHALSSGTISNTASLTADSNDRYGIYLDNITDSGFISLNGVTTSNNTLTGLNVLSSGVISLANITANNNGTKGNPGFRYGTYLDNRTGNAGVTISGVNDFSGNYSTGLVVLTNGTIIANGLNASENGNTGNSNSNYGYGVFLDNSSGAAGVALTDASVFNNYSSGLSVNSMSSVTLNNITAGVSVATGNGGHGVIIVSGSTVSLTGTNNMIGNVLSGVHVTAAGNINIYNTTANTNGQHGFYVETTNGVTILKCGNGENNGLYGVIAGQTIALHLLGMNLNGNVLGEINSNNAIIHHGNCDKVFDQSSNTLTQLGINAVFMAEASEWVTLDCSLYSGTKLILPNGDFALLPCPIGESASMNTLSKAGLPGALPIGWVFGSGFTLDVIANEQFAENVSGQVTISFMIPTSISSDVLAILFWNGSEWVDVDGVHNDGNRIEAQVDSPGMFVLVSK